LSRPDILLAAAHELGFDLSHSVLFGDRRSDLEAAHAAGAPHRVLLDTDGRAEPRDEDDGGLGNGTVAA
jgi:D-glycero-D-manno-heptose 1,7-bisphosphate phosphatase